MGKNTELKIIFLFLLSVLVFLVSIHSGTVHVGWSEVFSYWFNVKLDPDHRFLFQTLRVPRTTAAFAIGASLGVCGLVLQTLLKNPLAEPYTLGLSGGSSLGAILALTLALEPASLWIPALSALGCFFATAVVLGLGRRLEFESRSLILFGVMISLFFGALVVSGLSILSPQKMQAALFWLLGEFGTSRDIWIFRLGPFLLIGLIFLFFKSASLDALSLGETGALSLGFAPSRARLVLVLVCSALTALSVSVSGLVGFVGLVSPHVARKILRTSRHRALLAASALIGAIILVSADTVGRTVTGNGEIPAGSIAALIGAPILIFLLMEGKNAPTE